MTETGFFGASVLANITPDSDNRLKHLISSNFYGRSSLFYLYAIFRQYIFRRNILFRLMKTHAKCVEILHTNKIMKNDHKQGLLLNFIQHSHKYVNKNLYQQSSKLNCIICHIYSGILFGWLEPTTRSFLR